MSQECQHAVENAAAGGLRSGRQGGMQAAAVVRLYMRCCCPAASPPAASSKYRLLSTNTWPLMTELCRGAHADWPSP